VSFWISQEFADILIRPFVFDLPKPPNSIPPTFRCRPDFVSGIPIALETFCLKRVMPSSRLIENPPKFVPLGLGNFGVLRIDFLFPLIPVDDFIVFIIVPPTLRCLPDFVSGMPIDREMRDFIFVTPNALLTEKPPNPMLRSLVG
jgi:hypothetical protein